MSETIRPFRIDIPDEEVRLLRARLSDARWPAPRGNEEWDSGVPESYLHALTEYWATDFNWRLQEETLNSHPQFTTEIDGQQVHFMHVRSSSPDATPLLLTHGFPSSFAEFLGIIDALTNAASGRAFHLVVPSLPGYAFSTPLGSGQWSLGRTADAWIELMRRLGYRRYGVHGGDIGAAVSGLVAARDREHVLGLHVVTDPHTAAHVATFVPGLAARLDSSDPVDALILERMDAFRTEGSGYLAIQQSRPRTIGYGLVDSPLLQLAWIAEKFHEWTDLPIDRDQLLTTVSLYWFTGAGASAAHAMYDQARASDWGTSDVPQGFAVFGADATVRRLVPAPPHAYWSEFERGGHFPAMEAPSQLAADLRHFFSSLT